jgi:periplasmic protein TonB
MGSGPGGLGEGSGIIGAGGLKILYAPPPKYPMRSRVAEEQGVVLVIATVEPNGRVVHVELEDSCGFALLDQSALNTLPKWRFDPSSLTRYSSAVRVRIPVKFELNE